MKLEGSLIVVTGLHIGGSDDTMKIGGVDSNVIKRSVYVDIETGEVNFKAENRRKFTEPYIPGSSLKGKIRSILEHNYGLHSFLIKALKEIEKLPEDKKKKIILPAKGDVIKNRYINFLDSLKVQLDSLESIKKFLENKKLTIDDLKNLANLIILMFGDSESINKDEIIIPRVVFRDIFLNNSYRKEVLEGKTELTEAKTENTIDRLEGKVKKGGVRTIERVVPGVVFDLEVIIRDFDEDEELVNKCLNSLNKLGRNYKNINNMSLLIQEELKKAFEILKEEDYLGGNGSRGYGKVEIEFKEEIKKENDI